tara:strand:- start:106 stop:477 length:372 start_codon:yes stop_codon:yes gene_type:complete
MTPNDFPAVYFPILPIFLSLVQDIIFIDFGMGSPTSDKLNTSIREYLLLTNSDLYNACYEYQLNLCRKLRASGRTNIEIRDALLSINVVLSELSYEGEITDFSLCKKEETVISRLNGYVTKLK